MIWIIIFKWNILLLYWYQYCMCKWLFINYVIFFAPFQTTTSPFVIFWHTPPYPLPDDVIYERENDISMILFCKTQPYCLCIFFILEQFLMPVRGMVWLDCYISMVRVLYSGVSAFSLLTPASSSLSVIFCKTPPPSVILCHLLAYPPVPPDWMT